MQHIVGRKIWVQVCKVLEKKSCRQKRHQCMKDEDEVHMATGAEKIS